MIELAEKYTAKQELNHRWTTAEMHFGRGTTKVKRLFDLLPRAKMAPADYRPLPSSFNVGGIYRQKSIANEEVYEYGNEPIKQEDVRKSVRIRSQSVKRPMTQQINIKARFN